eukprot:Gb_20964 [translate_table: standard]
MDLENPRVSTSLPMRLRLYKVSFAVINMELIPFDLLTLFNSTLPGLGLGSGLPLGWCKRLTSPYYMLFPQVLPCQPTDDMLPIQAHKWCINCTRSARSFDIILQLMHHIVDVIQLCPIDVNASINVAAMS